MPVATPGVARRAIPVLIGVVAPTLPAGSPWTTDTEFDAIAAYFQAPAEDERFNVIRRERSEAGRRPPSFVRPN
jgi:hypothetical protein